MKKVISLALACLMAVGLLLSLTACGKLSGTYTEVLTGEISLKFSAFGSVTILNAEGKKIIRGDYEFERDGKIDIDFDDDDIERLSSANKTIALLYDGEHSYSKTEKDGETYITIGITTFRKK